MDNLLKTMLNAMKQTGAGFASVSVGKYTVMLTDDKQGAEYLQKAWDEYVESEEQNES